ncbi:MAG: glutamine--fructose-6-phosphate transaminase (isomerizing) [Candidatus Bilamarchaeum sp.]
MCGIIGYVGPKSASQIIFDGLKRLEYRGYDSVGIAVKDDSGSINISKDVGMVEEVGSKLKFANILGHLGIGHTRWATHGSVTKDNAHPHFDCNKSVVLAHNGVIENYLSLKSDLEKKGHNFVSGTDSEVIAHLFEENLKLLSPKEAFLLTVKSLTGSYAIVAILANSDQIFLARQNSPLIIGVGNDEMFCASDIPAVLDHTKKFITLLDGECAILSINSYEMFSLSGKTTKREPITVDWSSDIAKKGGYPHFMIKEIFDQPHALSQSIYADVLEAKSLISKYKKVHVIGCGTSYHSGLIFSHLLNISDHLAQTFIASDYSFVSKPDKDTLVIAITQSGETADVLQALRYAKAHNSKVLSLTNVVGSSVTTLSDGVVFLNAGPESGVAATKTFTAQLGVIYKIMFDQKLTDQIPSLVEKMLSKENEIKVMAQKLKNSEHAFFIARGRSVPIAYEGSLKFKEITYIHSEAYPGGELKHGTLSLITEGTPIIVLAPKDETITKLFGNLKEAKARGGQVFSFTNDPSVISESTLSVNLPEVSDPRLYSFALIVPLQLLAYHVSVLRGINPDRPRNLAKAVTVE